MTIKQLPVQTVAGKGRTMRSVMIAVCLLASVLAAEAASAPAANTPPQTIVSTPSKAPLPPAGAAPIRQAQGIGRQLLYWAAAGAVIITGVLLLYQDDDYTTTTTTSATGTN
jgi:hypothetical protein